jgi:hypothetical protein
MYKSTHFSLIEEHSSDRDKKMIVVHRGVGVNDPDLEATFTDPVHLTLVPSTYEELERLDNQRHARISSAPGVSLSNNSVSENPVTLQRKNNKKHKMPTNEDKVYDSSSPTSVENMEEGGEPPSVLHPASKKLAKMEKNVCYLSEVVANMTEKIAAWMGTQQTTVNHMESLIEICNNHSEKLLSQGAGIKSLQHMTGSIQHRLSEVEEAIDSNMERILVTVDSVTRLETECANLERRSNRMDDQLQQHRAAVEADGESSTGAADSCETGIFLSGIQNLREILEMRPTTDPVNVAGRLMHEIGSYGAINRVYIADKAVDKKERYKARAVIIYFNSTFHKRRAVFELKKFLQANAGLKATLSDVFPAAETPRALALTRYAADKRFDKSMTRTRIVNKSGSAVLQHTEGASKEYKNSEVAEADLEPYYQAREGGKRERQADRKRRNRDERELRDQDRAACRGNNSSDQSSFNHNQGQPQQQPSQRTGNQQKTAAPSLRICTPNSQPTANQRQPRVNTPMGNQQQNHVPQQQQPPYNQQRHSSPSSLLHQPPQHNNKQSMGSQQQQPGPQQQPPHNQQQGPTPAFLPQQPQQHDMQPTYYNNSTLNSQWSQGASCPPVQPVNPMPHGFTQVPQNLLPIIQQQIYRHQQFQQQQIQQQQYYTTENNNQQLLMRHDANSTNSN